MRIAVFLLCCWTAAAANLPLALHPRNPHYFLFRGHPAVLVTSGEHYGAVLNLDFDYKLYLRTLQRDKLNLTRLFTGAYREGPGMFKINGNTLAPQPGRFLAPWPERDGKFDLASRNSEFFARLRDFIGKASKRGIVVEVNLFCPYYEDAMWDLSPLNAKNNIQGIGTVNRTEALALKDPKLTDVQDALVRSIVNELRDFDNIYYEIANEPYFAGVTKEWQHHIAETIAAAESGFPHRHLISQNIANGSKKVDDPDPLVSIFNFHYARPPVAVAENYRLNKAIGCNETGFDGTADAIYRIQGWAFLMAGGALYNNLDYSFTAGHEDGTFAVPDTQPGGGSPALRRQLGILKAFFERMPLPDMKPADDAVATAPSGAVLHVLGAPGRYYAGYLHRATINKDRKPRYQVDPASKPSQFALSLPAGQYTVEWVDSRSGTVAARQRFRHSGGRHAFESPAYSEDMAFRLTTR